jgi:hypothetical protein
MKKSLAAVVLILITLVLCGTHRQRRIAKTFEDSAFGTLQSDVVKQLGAPWKTASCGQTLGERFRKAVKEELYAPPFAPAMPQYWSFMYEGNGEPDGQVSLCFSMFPPRHLCR